MNRLNLGSGLSAPSGWTNLDKVDNGQEYVADILQGLPFSDDYFDFVLMNHTLQMFGYDDHPIVLKEVFRVMKKGAILRILTPDLIKAIRAFTDRDYNYFPIGDELEKTWTGKFARYLFWHGETHCAFSYRSLKDLLKANGFRDVRRAKFGECELDSREKESLIVEASK